MGTDLNLSPFVRELEACGYTHSALAAVAEPIQSEIVSRLEPKWPVDLPERARLAIRLLALGQSLPLDEAKQIWPDLDLTPLVDAGILQIDADQVSALWSITPHEGLWVCSDPYSFLGDAMQGDHVLAPSNGTRIARLTTIPKAGGRAWDVGVGQGVQSASLAIAGMSVLATDISERALLAAKLTAAFNEVSGIEFRRASFFDSLGDEEFQTIVSNPPFILSAGQSLVGISSDSVLDAGVEHLAHNLPSRLAEGGWLTMVASWYEDDTGDWGSRPRKWLANCGGDAWIVLFSKSDPAAFGAEMAAVPGTEDFDPKLWDELRVKHNIKSVCYGLILVNKRAGKNWMRCEALPASTLRTAAANQIRQIFENTTLMSDGFAVHQPNKAVFRLASPISILENKDVAQIQQAEGFALPMNFPMPLAKALVRFDGSKRVNEVLGPYVKTTEAQGQLVLGLLRSGYLKLVAS